eukprot:CAMPEP_0168456370 /NCGR_PEP_ID=MMETSP0228-20121227/51256_1 /TAXON_ID=133427 /ORGANISM="Protoceratium reticulatum, Strain CCCM 535 (=CCMP 1889)" /LENGTH=49 /DNA_ID= /DNA_START= /DNA_END= /DNA_ORIENTATION=
MRPLEGLRSLRAPEALWWSHGSCWGAALILDASGAATVLRGGTAPSVSM